MEFDSPRVHQKGNRMARHVPLVGNNLELGAVKKPSWTSPTARLWHDRIAELLDTGIPVTEAHAAMAKEGYPLSYESVVRYVRKYFPVENRRWGNQYTKTKRCKRGHEWTEENTAWTWDSTKWKQVRYCRICERARRKVSK